MKTERTTPLTHSLLSTASSSKSLSAASQKVVRTQVDAEVAVGSKPSLVALDPKPAVVLHPVQLDLGHGNVITAWMTNPSEDMTNPSEETVLIQHRTLKGTIEVTPGAFPLQAGYVPDEGESLSTAFANALFDAAQMDKFLSFHHPQFPALLLEASPTGELEARRMVGWDRGAFAEQVSRASRSAPVALTVPSYVYK